MTSKTMDERYDIKLKTAMELEDNTHGVMLLCKEREDGSVETFLTLRNMNHAQCAVLFRMMADQITTSIKAAEEANKIAAENAVTTDIETVH